MDTQQQLELTLGYLNETDEDDPSASAAWEVIDELVYEMQLAERQAWRDGARAAMRRAG